MSQKIWPMKLVIKGNFYNFQEAEIDELEEEVEVGEPGVTNAQSG